MKKLKACIIGLGQVGIKFDLEEERRGCGEIWTHFSAYENLKDKFDLVAVVDPDESSWKYAVERLPNIRCFHAIEDLLQSNLDLDVVSICSPDDFHFSNLESIIDHVDSVFLEKPITTIEEASKAKVFFQKYSKKTIYINYYKRSDPSVLKMLDSILRNDESISYIECRYSGPFMAVGSHAIDLLNYIVSVAQVKATIMHEHNEGAGYSAIMVGSNNELINLSYTGERHNLIFELEVITDKSRYELGDNLQKYTQKFLMDSAKYKGYKEYLREKCNNFKYKDRFINYLHRMYSDTIRGEIDNSNILKSIESQELMQKIIKNKGEKC